MIKLPKRQAVIALAGFAMMILGTVQITRMVTNDLTLRHVDKFVSNLGSMTAGADCQVINEPLQNFRAGDLWRVCGREKGLLLQGKLRCLQDLVLLESNASSHMKDEDPCLYRDSIVKDKLHKEIR